MVHQAVGGLRGCGSYGRGRQRPTSSTWRSSCAAVRDEVRPEPVAGGYRQVLRDRALVRFALINVAMIAVGWGVLSWVVPPYARAIGIESSLIGLLILANAATVVLLQIPIVKAAEGRSRVGALSLAAGVWIVACLLVVLAQAVSARACRRMPCRRGGRLRPRRVPPCDLVHAAGRRPGPARPARAVHGDGWALLVGRPRARPDTRRAAARRLALLGADRSRRGRREDDRASASLRGRATGRRPRDPAARNALAARKHEERDRGEVAGGRGDRHQVEDLVVAEDGRHGVGPLNDVDDRPERVQDAACDDERRSG